MSNFVPEKTALGIEFGSTRIKAVLIGPEHTPLAQGDYTWENQLHNGIWTLPTGTGLAGPAKCLRCPCRRCTAKIRLHPDQGGLHWHFRHDARLPGL